LVRLAELSYGANDSQEFEALLEFVRQSRGFDFTGYKRSTLMRRVSKRVQQVGLEGFADYHDYLQVHTDEFPILFNTILINVTEFFRDRPAWDYVAREIVPRIARTDESRPVRVWTAGCASGEEAYTIAILLCEHLGPDEYAKRVKIYATDVDEEALAKARSGYSLKEIERLEPELRSRYFELQGGSYLFKTHLRKTLIFGRHDLLQDAPISRLDLLVCRNTLMYFTAESQDQVLSRFHYALNDHGSLFLGRAEMLLTQSALFTPVELKHRVFTRVPQSPPQDRIVLLGPTNSTGASGGAQRQPRLRELAGEVGPEPQVVLDAEGTLVLANQQARAQFGIRAEDIGASLKDLELSYRPVELRSLIDQTLRDQRPVSVSDVEHHVQGGGYRYYDVEVTPLIDDGGSVVGTSIVFNEVTEFRQLRTELERSKHEVETAYEELQSSNEELETTNEELQSTVEELETTNEELQSSNEELETMNEELESTNAELQTINGDLRQRTDDLDHLNAFMESILGSLGVGVAVLDAQLAVTMWNPRSEDLWGLRTDEVLRKPFFSLDFGLPTQELRDVVGSVLNGQEHNVERLLEATNRRGRAFQCRVAVSPLGDARGTTEGVVLLMEELPAA
jgi:two-component system, chemotaxis family, CheB/CheR fusion protein